MPKSSSISYCEHLTGDIEKLFKDELTQLLFGNYKSLKLKKLKPTIIYSIRVNRKDRLLFTPITHEDKPALLFLEHIPNHDYQKKKFLNNPKLLAEFVEKIQAEGGSLKEVSLSKSKKKRT